MPTAGLPASTATLPAVATPASLHPARQSILALTSAAIDLVYD